MLLKIAQIEVQVEGDGFDPTIPTVFMFNHITAIGMHPVTCVYV
jgi:hypothetical protein